MIDVFLYLVNGNGATIDNIRLTYETMQVVEDHD
jgi:hypothetical protein